MTAEAQRKRKGQGKSAPGLRFHCAPGGFEPSTPALYERAIGSKLDPPAFKPARAACACYLGCDIGAYSTCPHLCRYCYANRDARAVAANRARHDPASPFLIGGPEQGDRVHDVPQRSWKVDQLSLF